jgi:hypothetical protein
MVLPTLHQTQNACMNTLTFDTLSEFVSKKMRMSHIYQPLLIRSLLDCGGMATLRQLEKKDAVDIIIALGMAKEGFDWIWCERP